MVPEMINRINKSFKKRLVYLMHYYSPLLMRIPKRLPSCDQVFCTGKLFVVTPSWCLEGGKDECSTIETILENKFNVLHMGKFLNRNRFNVQIRCTDFKQYQTISGHVTCIDLFIFHCILLPVKNDV
ncbi:CLUMA_CG006681, isoform A [Clunio marinus]|uniref:CLUMA_CG006681, isoform A n=1 Tax=Clunio marinus TaxID=568069 RepID=A0A1J1I433_9DIPT|nr:CLUMA_CG006681, isoform A [Clunio marinus]